MFKKRSKVLFVANLFISLHVLILFIYYGTGLYMVYHELDFPNPLVIIYIIPLIIIMAIGVLLNWFSFFKEKPWASFIGSLFYSFAAFGFFPYLIFTAPIIILSFNGYFNQAKITNNNIMTLNLTILFLYVNMILENLNKKRIYMFCL